MKKKPDYIQLVLCILIASAITPAVTDTMTPSDTFRALFFGILLIAYLAYKKDDETGGD